MVTTCRSAAVLPSRYVIAGIAETGFGGIGPAARFARRDLLDYDAPIRGLMALRRLDNGASVELELNAAAVPFPAGMQALMSKAVAGQATPDELARFGTLWQERVRAMLLEHGNDPQLLRVL